jgi:methylglutamate dehydrogenase subunit D
MDNLHRELKLAAPLDFTKSYHGLQLVLTPAPVSTITSITARCGRLLDLQKTLSVFFETALPEARRSSMQAEVTVLSVAPRSWLVVRKGLDFEWQDRLAASVGDSGFVVSQSGAYALLDIQGENARALLTRGIFLDFYTFGESEVAITRLNHLQVVVWRLPGFDAFRLAIPRSVVEDAWSWLRARAESLAVAATLENQSPKERAAS